MLRDFEKFIKEDLDTTYRLIIDEDGDIPLGEEWDLSIDFSDMWNKYQNEQITLVDFVKEYKLKINEHKEEISNKKGITEWNELVMILNKLTDYQQDDVLSTFNEVYDWADKNNIEIKS